MDEALARVRAQLDTRLKAGARIVAVRIPTPMWEPEFQPAAGAVAEEVFQEYLSILAENRRLADEDPDYDAALHSGHGHVDPVPEESPASGHGCPVQPA